MWRDKVRRRTDGVTRARVMIEEEKGSDVNLGVHLVNGCSSWTHQQGAHFVQRQ